MEYRLGNGWRLVLNSVVCMLASLSIASFLQACIDPGIDIRDVTSHYINKAEKGFNYVLQQEFTLLKGASLISGLHLIPNCQVDNFLKDEETSPFGPSKSKIEKTISQNSKFRVVEITRMFDEWEDKTEADAS